MWLGLFVRKHLRSPYSQLRQVHLFFSKHHLFPKAYIARAVSYPVFLVLDAGLLTILMPDEPMFDAEGKKELTRAVFVCVV